MRTILASALCAGLLALGVAPASASTIEFNVNVNTTPLIGAGQYFLDFQLNGGAGSTVDLTGFSFGSGGSAGPGSPDIIPVGDPGVTGDLASGVHINTASSFLNDFLQEFTPGSNLHFGVRLTSSNPTPGAFSFQIYDGAFNPIPPMGVGNNGLSLILVTTSSTMGFGDVRTFAGLGPAAGSTIGVTADPVPEPASLLLLGVGLAGIGARRWRQRHQQQ